MTFQDRKHKHFFIYRQWWESPTDIQSFPHQTSKCSAPIYQAEQSRASYAKLLTASPYR